MGGYGEGSVYQRASDARWVANFRVAGKRHVAYGKTEREARRRRREALDRLARGDKPTPARTSFQHEADRWVEVTSRTLNLTPATRRNYVDVLRLHVLPSLGRMKMSAITPSDVSQTLLVMADKGLSPSYRHQAHKAISHVFKMSIQDGVVSMNPTRSVPAPRGAVKPRVVPDRTAVVELIQLAPDERLRTFIMLSAHTGLRIAEIMSLKWSDFAPQFRTISLVGKGGRPRSVYVTPSLEEQLRVWKVEQSRQQLAASWWSTEGWIITTEIGTRVDTHNFRSKDFKPFADAVAPGVTPHSLRHAFATVMLEEGVPMRVVADQMGHSSTRITEDTYSHVTARLKEEAGAAAERAFSM